MKNKESSKENLVSILIVLILIFFLIQTTTLKKVESSRVEIDKILEFLFKQECEILCSIRKKGAM